MKSEFKLAILLVFLSFAISVDFFIVVPIVHGWIPLEGHISQDTTLAITTEPYRAVNDVVVDPGVTLTVKPGVELQFADGFSLTVEGSLNASGTSDHPILFTSSRIDPYGGAWDAIRFNGSLGEIFLLRHVRIEYASHGASIGGVGEATIDSSKIRECGNGIELGGQRVHVRMSANTLESNYNGISSNNLINADAGIMITNNVILGNRDEGIFISSKEIRDIVFSNNTISSSGGDGIHLSSYRGDVCNISFFSNTIASCFDGISISSDRGEICNISFSSNRFLSNGGDGILFYSDDYALRDVMFSNNTISSSGGDGIHLSSDAPFDAIHNIEFSNNTIASNTGDGIHFNSYRQRIQNVLFSSNSILSNRYDGIYIRAHSYACNIVFFNNTISLNKWRGIYARASSNLDFDLTILNNAISTNDMEGIELERDVTANVSHNSISHNSGGIHFGTQNNLANYNDIYNNSYGIMGVTADVTYNYWGAPSGPYHASLNPEGEGNTVGGDGTDLDFIPFLNESVFPPNDRPVAILAVGKSTIAVNETAAFDASDSIDDGRIGHYFFDFGDGMNSGWVSCSKIVHRYTEEGEYRATLVVIDDSGVESFESEQTYVIITVVSSATSLKLPVPYESQGDAPWCWAASTAIILRYYGKQVHVWDIGRTRWNPPLDVAEIQTYISETYPGEFVTRVGSYSSISEQIRWDIESNVSSGYPVILQVYPEKRHMVVVTGYNSSGFFIHDPSGALFEELGRATQPPFIHRFVAWEELEPYICKGVLSNSVFLATEGVPSPIDATLSLHNTMGGVRTIHNSDYEKGVYVDYSGWHWHLGLYWNSLGDHGIAWDNKDNLVYSFKIFNHKNGEARFDFHIRIEGDEVVYSRTKADVLVPAYGVNNPSDTVILKDHLIEGQQFRVTSEISSHGSEEIIDSITLPPIYYGDKWMFFVAECPVKMLVTDPDGLRVGFDNVSLQTVNEIPHAVYYNSSDTAAEAVSIPNQKTGNYSVTVFGVESGTYNLTCISLDDEGLLSTDMTLVDAAIEEDESQTHIIPEFPLFTILPLFIIATLLVVTLYRRKHSM